MYRLFARLIILGAFSATATACAAGSGGSLPFAGSPNNGGGGPGTHQPGGTSTALLRFIQGSPDSGTGPSNAVDVCVDNLPLGVTGPAIAYGTASALYAVAGGISHTISVFPSQGAAFVGVECATAPGPYLGVSPISITTLSPGTPGNPNRETIVLGGTKVSGTTGLYVFGEPSFATVPGMEAISHNAAPAFSIAKPNGVGFGYTPIAGPPTVLVGASGVPAPVMAQPATSTVNANVQSPLPAPPASFYDGIGVPAGTPVPITTVPAPPLVGGQPYVIQLYAFDNLAGGLNLIALQEQITGLGF